MIFFLERSPWYVQTEIIIFPYFWSSPDGRTDRRPDGQTESDAYEPTVQFAQVGSKIVNQKLKIKIE